MCGDPWAPLVLIVLRVQPLGPMSLGAVSPPVWFFADRTWTWGQLRSLSTILLEAPLFTAIANLSLSTWVPLGTFLRLFQNRSNSQFGGFSLLPGSFFASYFPPHILYCNILSEPAATIFLKANLVQMPVFVTYSRYLELTE